MINRAPNLPNIQKETGSPIEIKKPSKKIVSEERFNDAAKFLTKNPDIINRLSKRELSDEMQESLEILKLAASGTYEDYLNSTQQTQDDANVQNNESLSPKDMDLNKVAEKMDREYAGLSESEKNEELVNLATEFEQKKKEGKASTSELLRLEVAYRLLGVNNIQEYQQKSQVNNNPANSTTSINTTPNESDPAKDQATLKRRDAKVLGINDLSENLANKQKLDGKIIESITSGSELEISDIKQLISLSAGDLEIFDGYVKESKKISAEKIRIKETDSVINELSSNISNTEFDKNAISQIIFEIVKSRINELPESIRLLPKFQSALESKSLKSVLTIIYNNVEIGSKIDIDLYDNPENLKKLVDQHPQLKEEVDRMVENKTQLLIDQSNKKIDEYWANSTESKVNKASKLYFEDQIKIVNNEIQVIKSESREADRIDNTMKNLKKDTYRPLELAQEMGRADPDIKFYKGNNLSSFHVESQEQSQIDQLENEKKDIDLIDKANPEIGKFKDLLVIENKKRKVLVFGGPDQKVVDDLNAKIKELRDNRISEIDREIRTIISSLNKKKEHAKKLQDTFDSLPTSFTNEINTDGKYITLQEAAALVAKKVENIVNYQTPQDLIDANNKLYDLEKKKSDLRRLT